MKKYIRIFALFLAVLSLMACTKDSGYRLIERDGKLYIYFENTDTDGSQNGASVSVESLALPFGSFAEMRSDILNGDFSEDELLHIKGNIRTCYRKEGELPVCNLDALYQLEFPEGLPEPTIMWTGPDYWQDIESDYAFVTAYHSSGYNISREKEYVMIDYLLNNENIVVTDVQEEADRNAKVCYYENRRGENKSVFYEIEKNNKTYYVCENFYLWDDDYVEGVPRTIRIYFEEGDYAGYIYVTHLVERPSVEWLTSFDFYEYTGE